MYLSLRRSAFNKSSKKCVNHSTVFIGPHSRRILTKAESHNGTCGLEIYALSSYAAGKPYKPKVSLATNQEELSLTLRIDAQHCHGTTDRVTSYYVNVTEMCERYPYCASGEEYCVILKTILSRYDVDRKRRQK